jgi:hypothetical protein
MGFGGFFEGFWERFERLAAFFLGFLGACQFFFFFFFFFFCEFWPIDSIVTMQMQY